MAVHLGCTLGTLFFSYLQKQTPILLSNFCVSAVQLVLVVLVENLLYVIHKVRKRL